MAARRVGIIGLGLIGASVGLALRERSTTTEVVGFDINSDNLHRAARQGAIHKSCGTLNEVCQGAEIVVLAAPVGAILQLLPEIAPYVQPNTLVTDTGGTKAEIVRVGEASLPAGAAFVGGHPLAGRLTAGVDQASGSLYQGAVYCLTPSPNVAPWGVDLAVHLVEELGAQPHFVTPDEHDAMLAGASHLPYFASAAIVNAAMSHPSWPEVETMTAGGFRSMTALVDADPRMWADVAATNSENITRQVDRLITTLQTLREKIATRDPSLVEELRKANESHGAWLAHRGEGPPPPSAPPPSAKTPLPKSGWFKRG